MTLTLSKIEDTEKREPTGPEKTQFLKQSGDFQRRFMDGSLAPDRGLQAWQKIAEGYVLTESGIVVPEKKPTELFLDKPIVHPHLLLLSQFEVEAPANFTLDGCPRTAYSLNGWNTNINDANFPRASLVKGKRYMAEIYQLRRSKSSESIIKIANEQKRILPGALGGAVLTSRYGANLPKDFWVVCLDKPEHLWRDACGLEVPCFFWCGVSWYFLPSFWQYDWIAGLYLVFFRELVLNP